MDQFIVVAFFILLAILDVLGRRRKQRRQRAGRPEPLEERGGVQTGPKGTEASGAPARVDSGESMVPAELWEEIAALARGERRPAPSDERRPEGPPATWGEPAATPVPTYDAEVERAGYDEAARERASTRSPSPVSRMELEVDRRLATPPRPLSGTGHPRTVVQASMHHVRRGGTRDARRAARIRTLLRRPPETLGDAVVVAEILGRPRAFESLD